ncbi:MAG: TIGR01620 family protein [Pseudomonadota bacterium]
MSASDRSTGYGAGAGGRDGPNGEAGAKRRPPQAFALDDERLEETPDAFQGTYGHEDHAEGAGDMPDDGGVAPPVHQPAALKALKGFSWGSVLLTALGGLAVLIAVTWATDAVLATLQRNDVIGWLALALAGLAVFALSAIIVREWLGFMRVRRLRDLQGDMARAMANGDTRAERRCLRRLKGLYTHRADMTARVRALAANEREVHDAGDLLRLAERDLMVPLDREAEAIIAQGAKRVSFATAISPFVVFDMLYVLATNLAMLRKLATLYGARPGWLGSLRLGRMVITHIVASGGIALTDDLLGQVLGQDLLRRLSRRLGEGLINGAITARIGLSAIALCRPMPFFEAKPVSLRDLVASLVRKRKPDGDDQTAGG